MGKDFASTCARAACCIARMQIVQHLPVLLGAAIFELHKNVDDVRKMCRALVACNGAIAGTVGLRKTREMLQAVLLRQTRLASAAIAMRKKVSAARERVRDCTASIERAKETERSSRLRESAARKDLEAFWRSSEGRSRGEYLAAVADLGALHELDWADVRAERPPFTGNKRMLGAVRRGLSLICSIPDDWDAVVLFLSSRQACEAAGTLGPAGRLLPAEFPVRLLAELQANTISPFQLAADSELLGALDDLLKGYPDFRPDDRRIVAISPALSALVRFIRAMTAHARQAAPALPLHRQAQAAKAMMQASREAVASAEREIELRASAQAAASEQLSHAAQAEEQLRHELAWTVQLCREARDIVKVWHGGEGLLVLEADLPRVPPEVLEPVVAHGEAGKLESFVPKLSSQQREAIRAYASQSAHRAALTIEQRAWHSFFCL